MNGAVKKEEKEKETNKGDGAGKFRSKVLDEIEKSIAPAILGHLDANLISAQARNSFLKDPACDTFVYVPENGSIEYNLCSGDILRIAIGRIYEKNKDRFAGICMLEGVTTVDNPRKEDDKVVQSKLSYLFKHHGKAPVVPLKREFPLIAEETTGESRPEKRPRTEDLPEMMKEKIKFLLLTRLEKINRLRNHLGVGPLSKTDELNISDKEIDEMHDLFFASHQH